MTHIAVTGIEHRVGDAVRHYAPAVQKKGSKALKHTALVLGEGLLLGVVASATALRSLAGAFEGRAEGGSR